MRRPRPLRRPLVLAPLVGLVAAALLVLPGAGAAQADVVPSPGLPSTGVADPHAVKVTLRRRPAGSPDRCSSTAANDGLPRLFVVERGGLIRTWTEAGGIASRLYLDIRGRVDSESGGERGLLGLAFSPRFASDRPFWVTYTDSTGALVISRFRAPSVLASTVSTASETKILRVAHPTYANHNAGMLVFGREGTLYISTGDGGGGGDPFGNAQDLSLDLRARSCGSTRFHGCSGRHYCVPHDNPYAAPGGARGAIWLSGVRNAWRFSVDRVQRRPLDRRRRPGRLRGGHPRPATGRAPGTSAGRAARPGPSTTRPAARPTATYHDPTIVYSHASGEAIIGGYVYRARRTQEPAGGSVRLRRLRQRQPLGARPGRDGEGRQCRHQPAHRVRRGRPAATSTPRPSTAGSTGWSDPRADLAVSTGGISGGAATQAAGLRSADLRARTTRPARSSPCQTSTSASTVSTVRWLRGRRPPSSSPTTVRSSSRGSVASSAT